jgi:hypothetical protein
VSPADEVFNWQMAQSPRPQSKRATQRGIIFKHYRKPVSKQDGEAWFNIRPGNVGDVNRITGKERAS